MGQGASTASAPGREPGMPRSLPTESQGRNAACAEIAGTAPLPTSPALALSTPVLCTGASQAFKDPGPKRARPRARLLSLPTSSLACARARLGREAVSHHSGCVDGLGPPHGPVCLCAHLKPWAPEGPSVPTSGLLRSLAAWMHTQDPQQGPGTVSNTGR